MQIEAFGKCIDIRTSIVFANEHELLGEVRAVYVPSDDSKEEQVLSVNWLDDEGFREQPTAYTNQISGNAYPALKFIVDSVDRLLNSDECTPLQQSEYDAGAW